MIWYWPYITRRRVAASGCGAWDSCPVSAHVSVKFCRRLWSRHRCQRKHYSRGASRIQLHKVSPHQTNFGGALMCLCVSLARWWRRSVLGVCSQATFVTILLSAGTLRARPSSKLYTPPFTDVQFCWWSFGAALALRCGPAHPHSGLCVCRLIVSSRLVAIFAS